MSAGGQADPECDAWIAAIHVTDHDLRPAGSGIVLDERRILTCRHVVIEKGAEKKVWVSFPKARGAAKFIHRQVERIVPPDARVADGDVMDLAILVLSESVPTGVIAAPLCFPQPVMLTGKQWWAFGFPNGDVLGSAADGKVGATLGYGWLRLHRESPDPIEVGFSGGGLWCPQFGAVVAIVGHADGGDGGGRAITLCEADTWFPDEDLRSLAGGDAVSRAAGTDPSVPEIAELAGQLAERPDALAIIHEVFDRTPAVAPPDATIVQLLARLLKLVQPSAETPLLQQVHELAAQRTIGVAGMAPAPDATSTNRSADGPCLLVVLRRNRFISDDFLLWLTLFPDGQSAQPQACDKLSGSLKEIQDQLRVIVPRILQTSRGLPLIEFAVPEDLIDTAFDRWPIASQAGQSGAQDYHLGDKYPVVVRDLDRMDSANLSVRDRERWEKRWKLLLACEDPAEDLLHAVDLNEVVGQRKEAVFQALAAALRLPESDGKAVIALLPVGGVATGKTGYARAGRAIAESLKAGFAEGMPAAIWLRHPSGRKVSATSDSDDDNDRTYITEALDQADPKLPSLLRDLPRRVWILRARATAGGRHASHPGRRLSLLWADPDRIWSPGDFQLPPPSSNGADL